jgi:hypothetical protein
MLHRVLLISVTTTLAFGSIAKAQNMPKRVQAAVKRSCLAQKGTPPFHLKATLAPSYERDKESNRTGEIEIWWVSPEKWRREVRSPDFKQIQIVDGVRVWQKNEGGFFPEWLRNLAVEVIDPVPPLAHVLEQVRTADIRAVMDQTHAQWVNMGSDGIVSKGIGAGIALKQDTGLVLYGGEVGWDGVFTDYRDFHGLAVAHKVSAGSPEVTATVTVLEDLPAILPSNLFDAAMVGGDKIPLSTVVVDELSLRKNLLPSKPAVWPALENGPLEGVVITKLQSIAKVRSAMLVSP